MLFSIWQGQQAPKVYSWCLLYFHRYEGWETAIYPIAECSAKQMSSRCLPEITAATTGEMAAAWIWAYLVQFEPDPEEWKAPLSEHYFGQRKSRSVKTLFLHFHPDRHPPQHAVQATLWFHALDTVLMWVRRFCLHTTAAVVRVLQLTYKPRRVGLMYWSNSLAQARVYGRLFRSLSDTGSKWMSFEPDATLHQMCAFSMRFWTASIADAPAIYLRPMQHTFEFSLNRHACAVKNLSSCIS